MPPGPEKGETPKAEKEPEKIDLDPKKNEEITVSGQSAAVRAGESLQILKKSLIVQKDKSDTLGKAAAALRPTTEAEMGIQSRGQQTKQELEAHAAKMREEELARPLLTRGEKGQEKQAEYAATEKWKKMSEGQRILTLIEAELGKSGVAKFKEEYRQTLMKQVNNTRTGKAFGDGEVPMKWVLNATGTEIARFQSEWTQKNNVSDNLYAEIRAEGVPRNVVAYLLEKARISGEA